MQKQTPKIIMFDHDEMESFSLKNMVLRHSYIVKRVSSLDEVLSISQQELSEIDAIFLPLNVKADESALAICLKLSATQERIVPHIACFIPSTDKALIESFYSAGADIVFYPPIEPGYIFNQISAIKRRRESGVSLTSDTESSTFHKEVLSSMLEFVNEGIIITDLSGEIIFYNHSAVRSLSEGFFEIPEHALLLKERLQRIVAEKDARAQALSPDEAALLPSTSAFELHFGGFSGLVRHTLLTREYNTAIGHVFSLTNKKDALHITELLIQGDRISSLALLLSASCLHILKADNFGMPPLITIDNALKTEPLCCDLSTVLPALLEVLDLVLSPLVHLRIESIPNRLIWIKRSHIFQALGFGILHASEFAGEGGETIVSFPRNDSPGRLSLSILARSAHSEETFFNDILRYVVEHNRSTSLAWLDAPSKIKYGLRATRLILEHYGCDVKYRILSSDTMEILFTLPTSEESALPHPKNNE